MELNKKLQLLFDYYKILLKKQQNNEIKFNSLPTMKDGIIDYFFKKVVDVFGFDGLPKVVAEEEFKDIDSPEFFHGFEEFSYGNNFLKDKKYHTGTGHINGFFATGDFDEAVIYTSEYNVNDEDESRVLNFKLKSEIMGINTNDLQVIYTAIYDDCMEYLSDEWFQKINEIIEFISKINDKDLKINFLNTLMEYPVLATILGYDYLIDNEEDNNFLVVLNRASMVVSESQVKVFENGASLENKQPLN